MLAFVTDGKHAGLDEDRPRPHPEGDSSGYVRVRMLAAGICNTDLELARGYMSFHGVLGHEFVGEALDGALAGRRVVGGINFGCGRCDFCARGLARHCPDRRVLGILGADGALAEELLMPAENLIEVPAAVSDEDAVFVEPLAAACEVLEQLPGTGRGAALVLGAGKLGPLVAQVLAAEGFAVDLVGRHLERLEWLEDRGVRRIGAAPPARRYPLVVEATGQTEGLSLAIDATEPRGTLVLKTTVSRCHEIDLAPVVINEINVLGSRCGRFEPALERLTDGRVEVGPLVDARYDLRQADTAFDRAGARGTRKVIVKGV